MKSAQKSAQKISRRICGESQDLNCIIPRFIYTQDLNLPRNLLRNLLRNLPRDLPRNLPRDLPRATESATPPTSKGLSSGCSCLSWSGSEERLKASATESATESATPPTSKGATQAVPASRLYSCPTVTPTAAVQPLSQSGARSKESTPPP